MMAVSRRATKELRAAEHLKTSRTAMETSMIPRSLRIVAVIQLINGLTSAVGILVQLLQSQISVDFGVLGIPIYFGLRRLSSGWRTCALVLLWISLLLSPVLFALGLAARSPAYFTLFGIRLANISPVWVSVAAVVVFLLSLWQYRVLTRPEIRSLFLRPVEGHAR